MSERGQKSPLGVQAFKFLLKSESLDVHGGRRVVDQAGIEKEVKKRSGELRPRHHDICAGSDSERRRAHQSIVVRGRVHVSRIGRCL